jgi:hypothetical protein
VGGATCDTGTLEDLDPLKLQSPKWNSFNTSNENEREKKEEGGLSSSWKKMYPNPSILHFLTFQRFIIDIGCIKIRR